MNPTATSQSPVGDPTCRFIAAPRNVISRPREKIRVHGSVDAVYRYDSPSGVVTAVYAQPFYRSAQQAARDATNVI